HGRSDRDPNRPARAKLPGLLFPGPDRGGASCGRPNVTGSASGLCIVELSDARGTYGHGRLVKE
ncbi:MAG: hypothetical protein KDC01_02430, partial [Flavobacteriales bacterium]|nr:hypothetical protein [Flavobacteriales bacterium]